MRGVLNVPMSDNLSARFAVASKETDGFIKNQITGQDQGK